MTLPSGLPRIGTYRLKELLGRGGMGEVFLAWDERLERHVALKRVLPDPPPDEHARLRFRREAKAVARLSHPAIVQVFELLETEDTDCLVMELVEGRGLKELIATGELDVVSTLRLACEIADGLSEAHGKGLIHRDLKPENVRVTPSFHAKILDFGLARLLWGDGLDHDSLGAEHGKALTKSGALVGTVHAMSPEQASGRAVDHRSDLFALGGLLYEMLSGEPPFRGHNVLDTLRRVTSESPTPLKELCPHLDLELVDLVNALLAKEPNERPQNARMVADTLERLRISAQTGSAAPLPVSPGRAPGARKPSSSEEGVATSDLADLPTGEWPSPEDLQTAEGEIETVVRALLFTDLVDSTRMVESLGDARAAEISARHDRVARDLMANYSGLEIDKTDGFLMLFERPFDAVACALAYHHALVDLSNELGVELAARAAVHLGELRLRHNSPDDVSRGAKPLEVEGLAKPTAARLMGLAGARQTLLSHSAFEMARRSAVDDERWDDDLRWLAHGEYQLQGVDDPVQVFEVGVADFAPLAAPADSPKAQRRVSVSEEMMLGWRPAPGQTVPRRPTWRLEQRLGEGGFGEVWLAVHESGEKRVFKFCFEASRLRALKREVTLFRLLKEALGHRDDIARVLDWSFDAAPYFLEAEHTEGGDLTAWAEEQGGLDEIPLATRVELVAQVADALAAAHSVGVLHKDVKPENVLITQDVNGHPRIRLTDFGVGALVDRSLLESQGLAAIGFTATLTEDASNAGSRRYMAPELQEGKTATIQADLYSLGVMLYQVVVGDFSRALAPGWQRDVEDPLLAQDISSLVDGSPNERPTAAGPVAEQLRALDRRRAELQAAERTDRRRHSLRIAGMVAAVLVLLLSALLVQSQLARRQAEHLQGRAEEAREQAEDLIGFMLGDLQEKLQAIGRLDALEGAGEKALTYFDALGEEDLNPQTRTRHAKALHQMGDVKMAQGDLDGALQLFQQSLAQTQELVDQEPEDLNALFELGQSHFWVGNVYWRQGDLEKALLYSEQYLALSQRLLELEPDRGDWQLEVFYGFNNVGEAHLEKGNLELALEQFRKASELGAQAVEQNPSSTSWREALVGSSLKVASLHLHAGRFEPALHHTDESIRNLNELMDEDSGVARRQRRLSVAHDIAATIKLYQGDLAGALDHSHKNLDLIERLIAGDPENQEWQNLQIQAWTLQGTLQAYAGHSAAAWHHLEKALARSDEISNDSSDAARQRTQVKILVAFGRQLAAEGRIDESKPLALRALDLIRPIADRSAEAGDLSLLADARMLWGLVLAENGDPQQASRTLLRAKESLADLPNLRPNDYWRLVEIHFRLGQPDKARLHAFTLLGMGFQHPRFLERCSAFGWDLPVTNNS